uniref:Uncharacterized protein n=1 Tax=Leptocylindrus danicus TaxID=163516 RepID=A0A7S2NZM2_9STRA|mmetsp:Transcript_19746/g.29366  ORF Transcript_19746/g.29366 Transcript_19746/m.29366 type:complete len:296 (+) Transcript_19746:559-1446(+)|eukprot:CAMPEP_0116027640 /NCGR_PEP_ID=MMETSP0321-20121206/14794_1 /TAXON_ID=163516 /ORGANISM="Leptocylindrus danicus var. danicus, Strain B650" /LENGTH=295 /DNA_ID=CAMNT_0003501123 /DNA_START=446 /DNA_END=1333 /DNA_ORIENTATION=-
MTSRRDDYPRKTNQNAAADYTAKDVMELRKAYRFVPNEDNNDNEGKQKRSTTKSTTWQERMARSYEQQLYREYVLADLTRVHLHQSSPMGLRWRTKSEVLQGKGEVSCGNKHCPSYQLHAPPHLNRPTTPAAAPAAGIDTGATMMEVQNEEDRLRTSYEYGQGLHSYEVLFAYQDNEEDHNNNNGVHRKNKKKNELVKLRLCIRCAPLLFYHKGWVLGAKQAREAGEIMMKQRRSSDDYDCVVDGKRKAGGMHSNDDHDVKKSAATAGRRDDGHGHVHVQVKRRKKCDRTNKRRK